MIINLTKKDYYEKITQKACDFFVNNRASLSGQSVRYGLRAGDMIRFRYEEATMITKCFAFSQCGKYAYVYADFFATPIDIESQLVTERPLILITKKINYWNEVANRLRGPQNLILEVIDELNRTGKAIVGYDKLPNGVSESKKVFDRLQVVCCQLEGTQGIYIQKTTLSEDNFRKELRLEVW